jgi:hypothetical protein
LPHISVCIFFLSFLFSVTVSGLFAITFLSVCIAWLHSSVTSSHSHWFEFTCVCLCVSFICHICLSSPS